MMRRNTGDRTVVVDANNTNSFGGSIVNKEFIGLYPKRQKMVRKNKHIPPKGSHLPFFEKLIEEGKYTQKELVEMACLEFPHLSKSTFQTVLTDSRNPKYNKLSRLVIKEPSGILHF